MSQQCKRLSPFHDISVRFINAHKPIPHKDVDIVYLEVLVLSDICAYLLLLSSVKVVLKGPGQSVHENIEETGAVVRI